jgi:hypothetical protein
MFHPFLGGSNTTGVISGAGTVTLPEHLSSPPIFSGVRVTRSLVLYLWFVDHTRRVNLVTNPVINHERGNLVQDFPS